MSIAAGNSLEHHWLPFTSNRDFKADPRLMVKAEGVYYWNHKGGRLIDGSAGLFCSAAGHGREEIAEAVYKSMLELDYTPHFQLAHPASFELARKVAALMPGDLDYVFFCNSGSESIDTAIKIALAYHRSRGEGQRQRFISRERAYHGVNIGGVSLSGMVRNRETFGAVMPGVAHMRHTWLPENRYTMGQPETGAELAEDLQRFVDLYGASTIAACVVEPIAGSTGVLVPPKGYLERLRQICDKHGILLIFDEVICGFGRMGDWFGAQAFGVTPDLITFAKCVNNGTVPMGGVIARQGIYDAFMQGPEYAVEFFHGYTYSAHALAVAAAHATLDILHEEDVPKRFAALANRIETGVHALRGEPNVIDIRNCGAAAAIELSPLPGQVGLRGLKVFEEGLKRGMLLRFTGDIIAMAPPVITTQDELDRMFNAVGEAIRAVA
jgi:beta-alanine--pyruvate transaminase